MPVVPFFEERGMSVGSPTPIGSSETARMEGEALAGFGKALYTVGLTIEKNAKLVKDEQDEQEAEVALGLATRQHLMHRQNERVTGTMEDPTGITTVKNIDDKMKPEIEAIVESTLTTPRAKRLFQVKLARSRADLVTGDLATGVEGNAARVKSLYDLSMAQNAAAAAEDPGKLQTFLDQATANVEKSLQIPAAMKEQEITNQRRNIIYATADRLKQNNDFDSARRVVEAYAKDLGTENVVKYSDDIRRAKSTFIMETWAASERQVTLDERRRESRRNKKFAELSTEADNALGDAFKMNQVIKKYETLAKADPDTYNQEFVTSLDNRIKGGGAKVHIVDENFEGQIFRAFMAPGKGQTFNYKGAIAAVTKGRATQEKKNELYGMINAIKDTERKDPLAAIYLQETLKNIGEQAEGQFSAYDLALNPNKGKAEAAQQRMQFLKRIDWGGVVSFGNIDAAATSFKRSRPTYIDRPTAPLSKAGAQGTAKSTMDQLRDARYDLKRAEMNKAPKSVIESKKRNLHSLEQRHLDLNRGDAARVGK